MVCCPHCGSVMAGPFDDAARALRANGMELRFGPKAWAFLSTLRHALGHPRPWQEIAEAVWPQAYSEEHAKANVHIMVHSLRKQLAGSGITIENVRGHGYRLVEAAP